MATADSFGLFWNSDSGDRKYNADSFERWLRKFFTSGVFEGDLQVLESSGMTVQIQTGYCNLFGKVGLFEVVNSITLDAANSRYPRIDTIVIERNDSDRIISLKKVTGAYSGDDPVATDPVWDETLGIYQLVLAQIYVGQGVSAITQADITDKRMDASLCGYITGTVEEIDFTQITAQFEAFLEDFKEDNYAEFDAWFQEMKDQLSTDAAGHLQAEIDVINGDITNINTALSNKADKTDLASISESGTTASQTISKGTYFYLDGVLVRSIADIASGATFTLNTNYVLVTAGALNDLERAVTQVDTQVDLKNTSPYITEKDGYAHVAVFGNLSGMVTINMSVGNTSVGALRTEKIAGANNTTLDTFVKKGTTLELGSVTVTNPDNYSALFFPIS